MLRLTDYRVLTLDGYGTLIDWEIGIWDALQPLIRHCQRKVAKTEFSTDDRELGRPELTPLGECGGAVELEIVS